MNKREGQIISRSFLSVFLLFFIEQLDKVQIIDLDIYINYIYIYIYLFLIYVKGNK